MKIVILDQLVELMGTKSWDLFDEFGDVDIYNSTDESETINRSKDADVIIVNKVDITEEVMDSCPNLKYIGLLSTGYNVVDVDYAKERGIAVANVPTYGTDTVAEYTIGMLLALCHRFELHSEAVKAGKWREINNFSFNITPQIELAGKNLGIIGYGKIGQRVAEIAKAFKLNILVLSRNDEEFEKDGVRFLNLDNFLALSDFVSFHCPYTPETDKMGNKEFFGKMKEGAFLLNMSRGQLVDEDALADALNSGLLGGAAIDALTVEPILDTNPLLTAKNIIITPHMAWTTEEAIARIMAVAIENLRSFINGEIMNRVV